MSSTSRERPTDGGRGSSLHARAGTFAELTHATTYRNVSSLAQAHKLQAYTCSRLPALVAYPARILLGSCDLACVYGNGSRSCAAVQSQVGQCERVLTRRVCARSYDRRSDRGGGSSRRSLSPRRRSPSRTPPRRRSPSPDYGVCVLVGSSQALHSFWRLSSPVLGYMITFSSAVCSNRILQTKNADVPLSHRLCPMYGSTWCCSHAGRRSAGRDGSLDRSRERSRTPRRDLGRDRSRTPPSRRSPRRSLSRSP